MSNEFESRVCEIAATFNTPICVFVHECNSFYAMAQHFMSLITIFVCRLPSCVQIHINIARRRRREEIHFWRLEGL